ncbi:RNA polymerase sigma factor [Leptospira ognonensis]|uniref:RNA polymerase sigma factor n=1 Tax=Leptospira ognonensis TaxID=2484945 RepID=A0A4R9K679_9LEPT|nr:RNA polymerase sigma factor [Leptospira ognonensis]TGL60138.1 RNA polymerase sigma factor [Leptospira ognonensis]
MEDPQLPLLEGCLKGNRKSFEDLVTFFQPKVFALALKFLWNPEDAEDGTQEILIKVISNLGSFRKESKLATWVFRIATNHLINTKKSSSEKRNVNFRKVEIELSKANVENTDSSEITKNLAIHVQAACTHAILLCLKRSYRIAFILGEVFHVSSSDGAWIMEISEANFRKKLSRARLQMDEFLGNHCGISSAKNPCRCKNRIAYSQKSKRINAYLELSENMKAKGTWKMKPLLSESNQVRKAAEVYHSGADFETRHDILKKIKQKIESNQWSLLN